MSSPELNFVMANPNAAVDRIEELENALGAAIRAARLALFVIRKQGIMPNSSWESGFEADLKTAEAAVSVSNGQRGGAS